MDGMILKGNKVISKTEVKVQGGSGMESPHALGAGENGKEAFVLRTISLSKQLQDPRIFNYLANLSR